MPLFDQPDSTAGLNPFVDVSFISTTVGQPNTVWDAYWIPQLESWEVKVDLRAV